MKSLLFVAFLLFLSGFFAFRAEAVYDLETRPNNIFGIHILFPSELEKAANLVNSTGGDWGYVTIPVQAGDRNIEKWQEFMHEARKNHIIPIVRVATNPYHKNTGVWRKPDDYDIVDFANFLDSLDWPTKNRYVLLFNEVNRSDEWGGDVPSPEEYADTVSYAVDVFKERSQEFFIIAGGLDNAAPNDGNNYLDNLVFLGMMGRHNPEVFAKIDGFSSHSYPNPNFSQAPSSTKVEGTSTYKHELAIAESFAQKKLPVFITETGWNADALPQSVIGEYFKMSMVEIWGNDPQVTAVTPFILESGGGPFDKFTFYKGGSLTAYGEEYKNIPKRKGEPELNNYPETAVNLAESREITRTKLKPTLPLIAEIRFTSELLRNYFKSLLALGT